MSATRMRRRLQPVERRREIKAAALQVFLTRGYERATIDDVVAAAEAAKGTFYLYFPSKRALFLELLDDFAEAVLASFESLDLRVAPVRDAGVDEIIELLKGAYRQFFRTCRSHQPLAQLFLQEALFDAQLRARRQEIYERFARLARRGLELGVELGVLRPLDSAVVAHAIVGMIERVATQWLLVERATDVEPLIHELARFEAFGILGQPATTSEGGDP